MAKKKQKAEVVEPVAAEAVAFNDFTFGDQEAKLTEDKQTEVKAHVKPTRYAKFGEN